MKAYLALLAGASALALANPAHAVLQFSADVGGTIIACVDGAACDLSGAPGTIVVGTTVVPNGAGAIEFLGSSQTQTTGGNNTLTTTSFQITNTGPAIDVTISVGGTDFVGPVTAISSSGSGTWTNASGSEITLQYYADTANDQGGESPTDHPGALLADSGLLTAASPADSINYNSGLVPFADADLYSMTLFTTGTIIAGSTATPSQLTGRSQTMVAVNEVPEPASLLILGGSLLGMGWFLWRRREAGEAAA